MEVLDSLFQSSLMGSTKTGITRGQFQQTATEVPTFLSIPKILIPAHVNSFLKHMYQVMLLRTL